MKAIILTLICFLIFFESYSHGQRKPYHLDFKQIDELIPFTKSELNLMYRLKVKELIIESKEGHYTYSN